MQQLVPVEAANEAREYIYSKLTNAGLWADDGWQTRSETPNQDQVRKFVKSIRHAKWFKPLLDPKVLMVADALCHGQAVKPVSPLHQLLFSAPFSSLTSPDPITRWEVPTSVWHTDYPRDGNPDSYGVQMFTFIDQVPPEGGGTLIIAGSHRILANRILGSKEVKRSLQGTDYWDKLTDKRLESRSRKTDFEGEFEGVPLQLVELHGEPGDVYFTDLRVLHTLTPNVLPRPRLMVTQRLPTESGSARINRCIEQLQQRRAQK